MGEYMPPVKLIQPYYDYKIDQNNPLYKPGDIVSCTVTESIDCLGDHELAAEIKYSDPEFCGIVVNYWRLDHVNKWID
jgi:hypothetical protein